MTSLSITSTSHGIVVTVRSRNGARAVAHLDEQRHPELAGVPEVLGNFGRTAEHATRTYQPDAALEEIRKRAASVFKAAKAALNASTASARAYLAANAKGIEVPASVDMSLAPERRTAWSKLPLAEQLKAVCVADLPTLAAILADGTGALAGVHSEVLPGARERLLILSHIERSSMAGNFPMQPTLQKLIATGVDQETLETAAGKVLDEHRQRGERLEALEGALQRLLAVIAVSLDMSADDTLQAILAA